MSWNDAPASGGGDNWGGGPAVASTWNDAPADSFGQKDTANFGGDDFGSGYVHCLLPAACMALPRLCLPNLGLAVLTRTTPTLPLVSPRVAASTAAKMGKCSCPQLDVLLLIFT